jgi:nucleotide-binding universal stress UspA family protein
MDDLGDSGESAAESISQPENRSGSQAAERRIVVGVDGSASSVDALRLAARNAAAFGVPLEAVTAWHLPAGFEVPLLVGWSPEQDAHARLETAAESVFGANRPTWFHTTTRRGPAARVLIEESEGAEMLVLGSRGRGGFVGLLLGSVSSTCAEHARCPVLIVHPMSSVAP